MQAILDSAGPGSIVDDYLILDPKAPKTTGYTTTKQQSFSEAIVFIIGGGNYIEYMNVLEHCQRSHIEQRKILYGSTEMLSANAFISQLSGLALD